MKYILLADENKDLVEDLAENLAKQAMKCEVLTATNGRQAAEILRTVAVDLVLTGITMPLMDGYTLIAQKNYWQPDVPAVAMISDTSSDTFKRLKALGVSECLEKPLDCESASRLLIAKLRAQLRRGRPALPICRNPSARHGPMETAILPSTSDYTAWKVFRIFQREGRDL